MSAYISEQLPRCRGTGFPGCIQPNQITQCIQQPSTPSVQLPRPGRPARKAECGKWSVLRPQPPPSPKVTKCRPTAAKPSPGSSSAMRDETVAGTRKPPACQLHQQPLKIPPPTIWPKPQNADAAQIPANSSQSSMQKVTPRPPQSKRSRSDR